MLVSNPFPNNALIFKIFEPIFTFPKRSDSLSTLKTISLYIQIVFS